MEREQIIRMAREAGVYTYPEWMHGVPMVTLERFFLLAFAAGAAAERNAILQMSRDQWFKTQADFEEAIRAREST